MNCDAVDVAVGTQLPPLCLPAISRTTLALFAGASGDHNPIHIDTDFAKLAGLDDVFAHGMLSMAYLGRLLTNWVAPEALRSYEVRFETVTPVHAQVTARATVSHIFEHDEERRATLDLVVTLADGTVSLVGNATVALNPHSRRSRVLHVDCPATPEPGDI